MAEPFELKHVTLNVVPDNQTKSSLAVVEKNGTSFEKHFDHKSWNLRWELFIRCPEEMHVAKVLLSVVQIDWKLTVFDFSFYKFLTEEQYQVRTNTCVLTKAQNNYVKRSRERTVVWKETSNATSFGEFNCLEQNFWTCYFL